MNNPIIAAWKAIFPQKQQSVEVRFFENKNLIINLLLNQDHKRLSTVDTLILLDLVEKELDGILRERFFNAHQEIAAIEKYISKHGKEEITERNS